MEITKGNPQPRSTSTRPDYNYIKFVYSKKKMNFVNSFLIFDINSSYCWLEESLAIKQ